MSILSRSVSRQMPLKRLVALAALVATAACNTDTATAPNIPTGFVLFINAAPRYTAVNFAIDDTSELVNQPYGGNAFVYAEALLVPRTFSATTGTTPIASAQSLVRADTFYTVVLTQHTTNGGLLILPDTVSAPASGQVAIRLVNVAPSAGAVDVYVTSETANLTTATPVASAVAFEAASLYLPFPAAPPPMRIRVTTAGTKIVVLDLDPFTLSTGQVVTILLLDATGGGSPLKSLIIGDRV